MRKKIWIWKGEAEIPEDAVIENPEK